MNANELVSEMNALGPQDLRVLFQYIADRLYDLQALEELAGVRHG